MMNGEKGFVKNTPELASVYRMYMGHRSILPKLITVCENKSQF